MIKTFCPLSFWSCLKFQIYKRKRACICYFQIAHFAPQKFASPGFAWPWFSTSLDTIDKGFVCRIIPTLITSRPTSKASSLFSFFVLYLWYGVGDLTPHRNHYPCGNVLAVIHFYRQMFSSTIEYSVTQENDPGRGALFSVCSWRHTFMQITRPPCWCSSRVWNFMQIYRHLYRVLFQMLCFMDISSEENPESQENILLRIPVLLN